MIEATCRFGFVPCVAEYVKKFYTLEEKFTVLDKKNGIFYNVEQQGDELPVAEYVAHNENVDSYISAGGDVTPAIQLLTDLPTIMPVSDNGISKWYIVETEYLRPFFDDMKVAIIYNDAKMTGNPKYRKIETTIEDLKTNYEQGDTYMVTALYINGIPVVQNAILDIEAIIAKCRSKVFNF